MEKHGENPSHHKKKKKNIQKTPTILRLRPGNTKKNQLPKIVNLGETPCTRSQFFSWPGKVKIIRKRLGSTISTYRRTHRTEWKPFSPWSGKSMENHLAILWKSWTGYLGMFMNTTLRAAGSSRKRLRHEFEICKELSLEKIGTAFPGNRKDDQWSGRNHWHKLDQFPRLKVGVDKLIAQWSLSIFRCPKCMSSPTLCSVWEKWETILLNPGRSKFNGIRTTILSANWIELMDDLWNSSGRFSQDSRQWQSSMRFNRWWENYSVNQRTSQAGSSSCQCLTTLYGMQKEMMNYVSIIQRQLKGMQKDSLAVIGLS